MTTRDEPPAPPAEAVDDADVEDGGAVVVTPRADGPVLVEGPVRLVAPDGSVSSSDRLFLCRCGHSAVKPLCDGSHKRHGFDAPGVAPTSRTR